MQKQILKTFFLSFALLVTLSTKSMETGYVQMGQEAQNNNALGFLTLPYDVIKEMFYYGHKGDDQVAALLHTVKHFMTMRCVNNFFNDYFFSKKIEDFCKTYNQETKDATLKKALGFINDFRYKKMKVPAMMLIFCGANVNTTNYCGSLLSRAIRYDDIEYATLLLKQGANPNSKSCGDPDFYSAKNKAMLQLLVAYKLDVHVTEPYSSYPHALWWTTESRYPADVMAYYLELGVNPRLLWSTNCILHRLAGVDDVRNVAVFLEKAKLLLDAIPDMITYKNDRGKTVIDVAKESLEKAKKYQKYGDKPEAYEQLIKLCEDKVRLVSAKPQNIISEKNILQDCIICLEEQKKVLQVPCDNNHSEYMCVECYEKIKKKNNQCPLCNKQLNGL